MPVAAARWRPSDQLPRRGHRRPCCRLLHAFPIQAEQWAPQLACLSAQHRVIAPDLKASGGPTRPDNRAGYTMDSYADKVGGLLDQLGIERAGGGRPVDGWLRDLRLPAPPPPAGGGPGAGRHPGGGRHPRGAPAPQRAAGPDRRRRHRRRYGSTAGRPPRCPHQGPATRAGRPCERAHGRQLPRRGGWCAGGDEGPTRLHPGPRRHRRPHPGAGGRRRRPVAARGDAGVPGPDPVVTPGAAGGGRPPVEPRSRRRVQRRAGRLPGRGEGGQARR